MTIGNLQIQERPIQAVGQVCQAASATSQWFRSTVGRTTGTGGLLQSCRPVPFTALGYVYSVRLGSFRCHSETKRSRAMRLFCSLRPGLKT